MRGTALIDEINSSENAEEMVLIGIPLPTYKAISDRAALMNLTVGQLIARVLDSAVRTNDSRVERK